MSRLLLARHGNTKGNSAERFWGQTDVELSAEGIWQAERLADGLVGEKIDAIYASQLSRASATAEIIASRHDLTVTSLSELDEIDFGLAEGLTFDEMKKLHPDIAEAFNDWRAPLAFPGGESTGELHQRGLKFLNHLTKHKPEETILIVSHFSTLRLMVCDLLAIAPEHWRQMQTDLASLSIIETYPQGAILKLLNGVSHLQP